MYGLSMQRTIQAQLGCTVQVNFTVCDTERRSGLSYYRLNTSSTLVLPTLVLVPSELKQALAHLSEGDQATLLGVLAVDR